MRPDAGLYQHFKGGFYHVLKIARHSETLEEMVVYSADVGGCVWVRPLSEWNEEVLWPSGLWKPRFRRMSPEHPTSKGGLR